MMNLNVDNPNYYRAHPYRLQGDLPDSAFKNRQMPNSYSQIPQGKQYFEPSNKKHYINKYRSQIQEQNVFKPNHPQFFQQMQKSNIVMDRSYFRSLNVDDIEGTKPNTLISKAVKNKQKALSIKKQQINLSNSRKKQQQRRQYQLKLNNNQIIKVQQNYDMQQQALGKYMKNKTGFQNNSMINLTTHNTNQQNNNAKNYHFIRHPTLYTQVNERKDQSVPVNLNSNFNQRQQFQRQLQTRRRLINEPYHRQKNNERNNQKNIGIIYQSYPNLNHSQINNTNNSHQQYQMNRIQNQQIIQVSLPHNKQEYFENYVKNNSHPNHNSFDNQKINLKQSNQNSTPKYQNETIKNVNQMMQLDKSLIRKYYNPTFLSYESGGLRLNQDIKQSQLINNDKNQRSLSLAARNIVQGNQHYYK